MINFLKLFYLLSMLNAPPRDNTANVRVAIFTIIICSINIYSTNRIGNVISSFTYENLFTVNDKDMI